jgi:hypothetical protein
MENHELKNWAITKAIIQKFLNRFRNFNWLKIRTLPKAFLFKRFNFFM